MLIIPFTTKADNEKAIDFIKPFKFKRFNTHTHRAKIEF